MRTMSSRAPNTPPETRPIAAVEALARDAEQLRRATGPVIHAVPPMDKAEEIPWEEWYRLDGQLHHTVLFLGQRAETTGEFVGDAEDLDHPRAVLGRRWFLQNALTPRPYLSEGRSRI